MRIAVASRYPGDSSVPGPGYFRALLSRGASGEFVGRIGADYAAQKYDALLLGGGGDLHPALFGAQGTGTAPFGRDESEIRLTHAFLARGKRVLGICRGIQVLAVALGGTLAQDLPAVSALCHGDESLGHPALFFRPFTSCAGLPLDLPFARAWVNSAHHQAVLSPGAARVFALAPDGTVEGIVYQNLAVGVQFHPERMAGDLFDPIWDWFLRGVSRG